jgi:hypothetical protein
MRSDRRRVSQSTSVSELFVLTEHEDAPGAVRYPGASSALKRLSRPVARTPTASGTPRSSRRAPPSAAGRAPAGRWSLASGRSVRGAPPRYSPIGRPALSLQLTVQTERLITDRTQIVLMDDEVGVARRPAALAGRPCLVEPHLRGLLLSCFRHHLRPLGPETSSRPPGLIISNHARYQRCWLGRSTATARWQRSTPAS